MSQFPVVVIGASAGGVSVLLELAQALPSGFPAVIAVALHVGKQRSILPALMSERGPLPAMHPQDGEVPRPGTIYVAPPDHHLLLSPTALRLSRGPRENHARPAIDPMFRTAALGWRERAIGVVLSGTLDDGTAGLVAIKDCGGTAIVQDPATAIEPGMPASAMANVKVDHCLAVADIVPMLQRLVGQPHASAPTQPAGYLLREQSVFEGNQNMSETISQLAALGPASGLTCPECGGGLWEVSPARPLRYRCHTGHAYSALTLESAQVEVAGHALQSSLRSLQERELLLLRLASVAEATGDAAQAAAGRKQAERVHEQARALAKMIEEQAVGA